MKDMCKGRGKKGEGWRELLSRLLSRRLIPIRAGQRGRGGLGKPFPRGKTDASFGQLSFFLSVLIICSAYSREGLKQNTGLCVPPPCPNEGGVSGLALGSVCSHTMERGPAPPGCSSRAQPPTREGTSGKLQDKKNEGEFCGRSAPSKMGVS